MAVLRKSQYVTIAQKHKIGEQIFENQTSLALNAANLVLYTISYMQLAYKTVWSLKYIYCADLFVVIVTYSCTRVIAMDVVSCCPLACFFLPIEDGSYRVMSRCIGDISRILSLFFRNYCPMISQLGQLSISRGHMQSRDCAMTFH